MHLTSAVVAAAATTPSPLAGLVGLLDSIPLIGTVVQLLLGTDGTGGLLGGLLGGLINGLLGGLLDGL